MRSGVVPAGAGAVMCEPWMYQRPTTSGGRLRRFSASQSRSGSAPTETAGTATPVPSAATAKAASSAPRSGAASA